eukprot:COSAG05_NODE_17_length_35518_cov_34.728084_1_plen_55_part_10
MLQQGVGMLLLASLTLIAPWARLTVATTAQAQTAMATVVTEATTLIHSDPVEVLP